MVKQSKPRQPYKKTLSVYEINALAKEHANEQVFSANQYGQRVVEPWLKIFRFNQAWEIAEKILGISIGEEEFQACWARTPSPPPKNIPSEPPNTATFGGYRLRTRSALDRAQKQKPRPKKK